MATETDAAAIQAKLERLHAEARKTAPPYAIRKALREATLKIGRV